MQYVSLMAITTSTENTSVWRLQFNTSLSPVVYIAPITFIHGIKMNVYEYLLNNKLAIKITVTWPRVYKVSPSVQVGVILTIYKRSLEFSRFMRMCDAKLCCSSVVSVPWDWYSVEIEQFHCWLGLLYFPLKEYQINDKKFEKWWEGHVQRVSLNTNNVYQYLCSMDN